MKIAKNEIGDILHAAEFMDFQSMRHCTSMIPNLENPLEDKDDCFYAIIEASCPNEDDDIAARLERLIQECQEEI